MKSWICLLVFGYVPFVLSSGDSLLEPCEVRDIVCLSRSTEKFLENTCKGIPEYDIKPIDPLIISGPVNYLVDKDLGVVLRFRNLNVTGLRQQKISDFQMDLNAKSVILKTKADLNIVGDITIELDGSKTLSGIYHATASILGTARYNYELQKNEKNVEHFIVGPETLTCEAIEEPTVSLNHELQDNLVKDPNALAKLSAYEANKVNYRKRAICTIAEVAYADVVHNIRASAKLFPKTAFFKDV